MRKQTPKTWHCCYTLKIIHDQNVDKTNYNTFNHSSIVYVVLFYLFMNASMLCTSMLKSGRVVFDVDGANAGQKCDGAQL